MSIVSSPKIYKGRGLLWNVQCSYDCFLFFLYIYSHLFFQKKTSNIRNLEEVRRNCFYPSTGFYFTLQNFFYPPWKNIMMYIKLLVLIGFDLHFPLISGIYILNQIGFISYLSAFTLFYIILYIQYINYKDL